MRVCVWNVNSLTTTSSALWLWKNICPSSQLEERRTFSFVGPTGFVSLFPWCVFSIVLAVGKHAGCSKTFSCSCFPWIFEEFHFDNIIWCQFDYYGLLFSFPCVLLRCQCHCFLYSNRDILLVTICINLLESNWKIGSHLLVILWLPDAFLLTPYQLIHSFV